MDRSADIAKLKEKLKVIEIKNMEIDDKVLRRYLVAHRKVDAAFEKILATDKWREEFGVAQLTGDSPGVKRSQGHRVYRLLDAKDKLGRPVGYILARNHSFRKRNLEDLTQFIVWKMEEGCARCQESGIENTCALYDLKGFTLASLDYPLLRVLYSTLIDHYPERLGVCLVLNAPAFFPPIWAILRTWLDENSASKIKFIKNDEELATYVDLSIIPTDMD
ncbi:hypothetical protein SK128_010313 [Halocaridina rubra]|uniref:CRAL-TRIO domain-containing protein n=1 Tax=Halocaridina rubra TaxID=373956 RepID=A0AAN8WTX9_HALRR